MEATDPGIKSSRGHLRYPDPELLVLCLVLFCVSPARDWGGDSLSARGQRTAHSRQTDTEGVGTNCVKASDLPANRV